MVRTASLDRGTERALARSARAGDRHALHRLVYSHEFLVSLMVQKYARFGVSSEDLFSEGRLGLVHAARRYDPERGTRFTTYARWWVRACMKAYAMSNRRIVAQPQTRIMRSLSSALTRARQEQEQKSKGPVSRRKLARYLGVTEEDVSEAEAIRARRDIPLHPVTTIQKGFEPTSQQASPEEQVAEFEERRMTSDALAGALRALDTRDQYIVRQRYLDGAQRSLQSLASELGVSCERVRQLERRALQRVRSALLDRIRGSP